MQFRLVIGAQFADGIYFIHSGPMLEEMNVLVWWMGYQANGLFCPGQHRIVARCWSSCRPG